ncbi:hypothetical protein D6C92_04987 [Aureobasidium pullulans]|nr:hypothetical protein D6C92_04987 [Aureobasidium pullulans]
MSTFFAPPAEAAIHRSATLLISLGAVFITLTTVSLILRIWVRTKIVACLGKDDWAMLVTQACYVITCGLLFKWAAIETALTPQKGLKPYVKVFKSEHSITMPTLTTRQSYDLLVISTATYLVTNLLLKLSLALFFLRFVIDRWARRSIWGITIFLLFWTSGVFLFSLFFCGLPDDILKKTMKGGKCISPRTTIILGVTWGVSNVLTDWFFALIPVMILLRSRLPRATKISAVAVMAIAVVGSCTAIPRVASYTKLGKATSYWTGTTDFLIWSIIEPGVGILAANIATLRPLLDKTMQACISGRGVVEAEQGVNKININAEKCDSHSEGTEPKSDISASGMYSNTSISSVPPPWETEVEFVTAVTFDDEANAMEKGNL